MNWKTKIITIFLSVSLIACEDKAAIAKIESAKAESAKAEAAKTEATAKIESAKAEAAKAEAAKAEATAKIESAKAEAAKAEAAKAEATAKIESAKAEATKTDVANNQRLVVINVINYLKNEDFGLELEWKKESFSTSLYWENVRRYQYKDFNFDEGKKILSFKQILESMHNKRGSESENGFFSVVIEYKIDLRSADPLVRMKDYMDDKVQLPAKKVSLNAMISWRQVSVNEYNINESSINTQPFDGFSKREAEFTVSPDVAPRLKTALEDLLKAHGVAVSKY